MIPQISELKRYKLGDTGDQTVKPELSETENAAAAAAAGAMSPSTLTSKDNLTDRTVTIIINGTKQDSFSLAKLSKMSPVFNKSFITDFKEGQTGVLRIPITDNEKETLTTDFLTYLKHGKVGINEDTAIELYKLAHTYDIKDLMERCESFILENLSDDDLNNQNFSKKIFEFALQYHAFKIISKMVNEENAKSIYIYAHKHEIKDLMVKCENYILKDLDYNSIKDPRFLKNILEFSLKFNAQKINARIIYYLINYDKIIMKMKGKANAIFKLYNYIKKLELKKHITTICQEINDLICIKNSINHIIKNEFHELDKLTQTFKDLFEYYSTKKFLLIHSEDKVLKFFKKIELDLFPKEYISINTDGSLDIEIDQDFLTEEGIAQIKKLNDIGSITSFKLENGKETTDDQLAELAKILPNLHSFSFAIICDPILGTIHNNKITKLPTVWLNSLDVIICRGWDALTTIKALNATEINFESCPSLTDLYAPKAKKINCEFCFALTKLYAPNADEVFVHYCDNLKNITVKRGCKILGLETLTSNPVIAYV